MGMYEIIVGVGTIIILGLFWILLAHPFNMIVEIFIGLSSPATIEQYNLANNVFYFSYFFISFIIFIWIIRTSMQHQERIDKYG